MLSERSVFFHVIIQYRCNVITAAPFLKLTINLRCVCYDLRKCFKPSFFTSLRDPPHTAVYLHWTRNASETCRLSCFPQLRVVSTVKKRKTEKKWVIVSFIFLSQSCQSIEACVITHNLLSVTYRIHERAKCGAVLNKRRSSRVQKLAMPP